MKKSFLVAAILAGAVAFSGWSQESGSQQSRNPKADYKQEFVESKINYRCIPIYRVLDQPEAYIVLYQKAQHSIGQVTIPKKWYAADGKKAKKLQFRNVSDGILPYMTIFTRDGAFDHVLLSMPLSRKSSYWAVAETGTKVEDADKETLELVY